MHGNYRSIAYHVEAKLIREFKAFVSVIIMRIGYAQVGRIQEVEYQDSVDSYVRVINKLQKDHHISEAPQKEDN